MQFPRHIAMIGLTTRSPPKSGSARAYDSSPTRTGKKRESLSQERTDDFVSVTRTITTTRSSSPARPLCDEHGRVRRPSWYRALRHCGRVSRGGEEVPARMEDSTWVGATAVRIRARSRVGDRGHALKGTADRSRSISPRRDLGSPSSAITSSKASADKTDLRVGDTHREIRAQPERWTWSCSGSFRRGTTHATRHLAGCAALNPSNEMRRNRAPRLWIQTKVRIRPASASTGRSKRQSFGRLASRSSLPDTWQYS
jgi:hypothetical protein